MVMVIEGIAMENLIVLRTTSYLCCFEILSSSFVKLNRITNAIP